MKRNICCPPCIKEWREIARSHPLEAGPPEYVHIVEGPTVYIDQVGDRCDL